jgi:hypothetical protein
MTPKQRQGTHSGQGLEGQCDCGCGSRARGRGPGGSCVCTVCEHRIPHERGVPCRAVKCPQCGRAMKRQD